MAVPQHPGSHPCEGQQVRPLPLSQRSGTATTLPHKQGRPHRRNGIEVGRRRSCQIPHSPDEESVAAVLRRLGEHGRSTGCSGPVAFIPSHGSRPHLKWKPPATRGGPSGHTGRTSTLAAAPLGRYVLVGVHSGAETRYNEATAVRVARSSLGSQCEPGVAHAQFRSP